MLHIFTDICWKVLSGKGFCLISAICKFFSPWILDMKKSVGKTILSNCSCFCLTLFTGTQVMEEATGVIGNCFTGSIMQADSRDVMGSFTEFVFRLLLWIMQPSVRSAHCPPLDFLVSFVTITHLLLTPGPNPEPPPTQLPLSSSTDPPSRPPVKLRKTETV